LGAPRDLGFAPWGPPGGYKPHRGESLGIWPLLGTTGFPQAQRSGPRAKAPGPLRPRPFFPGPPLGPKGLPQVFPPSSWEPGDHMDFRAHPGNQPGPLGGPPGFQGPFWAVFSGPGSPGPLCAPPICAPPGPQGDPGTLFPLFPPKGGPPGPRGTRFPNAGNPLGNQPGKFSQGTPFPQGPPKKREIGTQGKLGAGAPGIRTLLANGTGPCALLPFQFGKKRIQSHQPPPANFLAFQSLGFPCPLPAQYPQGQRIRVWELKPWKIFIYPHPLPGSPEKGASAMADWDGTGALLEDGDAHDFMHGFIDLVFRLSGTLVHSGLQIQLSGGQPQ